MFKLTIATGNAAFEGPACAEEIARILRRLAGQLITDGFSGSESLTDSNGNRVGSYSFDGDAGGVDEDEDTADIGPGTVNGDLGRVLQEIDGARLGRRHRAAIDEAAERLIENPDQD